MPTTPGGTAYTTTAFTTSAGESAWRTIADSRVSQPGIPLVIFCHGNPGAVTTDADQQFSLSGYAPVRNWLIDNGWAYVEGHGAGANWGNAAGRTAYEAMFSAAKAVWDVRRVVVIGRSMGALVGAWLASRSTLVAPWCAGFISLSGTADLTNRYSTAGTTDRTNMNAAYGVTDDTSWRAAVPSYDPMLVPAGSWNLRNAQMQWDTSDTTVPYAVNGQAWDTKYGPELTLRRTITTSGGDHNTTPNDATHQAATISFLQDARLNDGVWSDVWSDLWSQQAFVTSAIGTLTASGTATAFPSYTREGVGVLSATGTAEATTVYTRTAQGVLTASGTADATTIYARTAEGTLTASGSAEVSGGTATRTANGTATASGTATVITRYTRSAEGVLTASGLGDAIARIILTATGTLTASGTAVADVTGGTVVRSATGVATASGSADAVVRYTRTAAGVATASGSGEVAGGSLIRTAVGTLTASGTASATTIYVRVAEGILTASGSGLLEGGSISRTAVGVLTATGQAELLQRYILTATGILTASGVGTMVPPAGWPIFPANRSVSVVTPARVVSLTEKRSVSIG